MNKKVALPVDRRGKIAYLAPMKMKNRKLRITVAGLISLLIALGTIPGKAEEGVSPVTQGGSVGKDILAKGEGIVVTKSDVEDLRDLMKEGGFESTEKEHIKAAVKLALFSKEAESMGIGLPEEVITGNEKYGFEVGGIEHKWINKVRYFKHIYGTYPISDAAIKSFYWANPEMYEESVEVKDEEGKTHWVKEMVELDDKLRERIRRKLIKARFPMILYEEYSRLLDKYAVRYCKTGGCD